MLDQISHETTILTPNRRLASQIRLDMAQQQQAEAAAWRVPDVLPWEQWLIRQYQQQLAAGATQRVLLNEQQQRIVWQRIIQDSAVGVALLNSSACVEQVMSAWQLLHLWQVPCTQAQYAVTTDTEQFYHWVQQFQQYCQQQQVMTVVELNNWLQSKVDAEQALVLIGFDELAPAQQQLLEKHNNYIEASSHLERVANHQLCGKSYNNLSEEIQAMAQWAFAQWQEDPKQKIACVVPNLTEIRTQLDHQWRQSFYSRQLFITATGTQAYNISGGDSLASMPVIHHALQLLQLADEQWPLKLISDVLHSPFISGEQEELAQRLQLEIRLHEQGQAQVSQYHFLALAQQHTPQLHQALLSALPRIAGKRLWPSDWPAVISDYLLAFSWPGERVLDSNEYQQVSAFKQVLEQFASLDLVLSELSYHEMRQYLQQMLRQSIFQVESSAGAVQVLGVLEAAGNRYDKLWIMNLHDEIMPPKPSPNPFIPMSLQKELSLPHATAARELFYNQRLLDHLIHSAQQVTMSYPRQEGDRVLSPSPLITGYLPSISELSLGVEPCLATAELQSFEDDYGPAIDVAHKVRGGTGIFKSQAACPFQAFARYRLQAYSLAPVEFGLSYLDRGILLHDILQALWQQLQTQEALLQQDWQELLLQQIQLQLDAVQQHGTALPPPFYQLEQQRLFELINRWLQLETERQAFKVVALEKSIKLQFDKLHCQVQLDRLDQLDNGKLVLLDYKTGMPSVNDWFGERPNEPQLPLYAISLGDKIAGMAFAQLHVKETAFKGIAEDETIMPGIKLLAKINVDEKGDSWAEQIAHWHEIMNQLAQQFCQGYAAVDPKTASVCQYCDLHSFCRILET